MSLILNDKSRFFKFQAKKNQFLFSNTPEKLMAHHCSHLAYCSWCRW